VVRKILRKYAGLLKGRDKGTVAITFLLSLPILMAVIGVLVQFALLANARLTVDRAVASAARSAMTAVPTDQNLGDAGGVNYPVRSALMVLESLSPQSPNMVGDGETIKEALTQVGANPPGSYAARYDYAQQAAVVTIVPIDGNGNVISGVNYAATAAGRVRITVTYDFQLTVPAANVMVGRAATVAGVTGRFLTLTSSLDVQLSHGRETPADAEGTP
jgi:Flp pilus assembly protein TadG